MSCFVINESGRSIRVTVDPDEQVREPGRHRYNVIVSKDKVDRLRHLEEFTLASNRRRQIYCLLEPYNLLIDNRLPSSLWLSDKEPDGTDLMIVRDLQ
jgi:hypothetical protein